VEKTAFKSMVELRKTFASADLVGDKVVFNIGGNKYRLIAAVHFNLPHTERAVLPDGGAMSKFPFSTRFRCIIRVWELWSSRGKLT
jgi:hypothetical protein